MVGGSTVRSWKAIRRRRAAMACTFFIPLELRYTYEQARTFTSNELVAHERPDSFTTPRAVSRREKGKCTSIGRRLAGQDDFSPLCVACLRGRAGRDSAGMARGDAAIEAEQFHIGNALARFDRVGDSFAGVLGQPQKLNQLEKRASGLRELQETSAPAYQVEESKMPIRTPFALRSDGARNGTTLDPVDKVDAAQKTVQSALFADPH